MFRISVQSDLDKIITNLDVLAKRQIPFATSLALNNVAKIARDSLKAAMQVKFDRPTPFTLNSLFIKPATKTTLQAVIGHKYGSDRLTASTYLRPEIEGGSRTFKSTEKGAGDFIVPARATKLDSYGNIPGRLLGAIRQLLESRQDSVDFGGRTLVVIREGNPRGLAAGVYERINGKVKVSGGKGNKKATQSGGTFKPIVFFETHVRYRQRYDLNGIVQQVVAAEFARQFAISMSYAVNTSNTSASL